MHHRKYQSETQITEKKSFVILYFFVLLLDACDMCDVQVLGSNLKLKDIQKIEITELDMQTISKIYNKEKEKENKLKTRDSAASAGGSDTYSITSYDGTSVDFFTTEIVTLRSMSNNLSNTAAQSTSGRSINMLNSRSSTSTAASSPETQVSNSKSNEDAMKLIMMSDNTSAKHHDQSYSLMMSAFGIDLETQDKTSNSNNWNV